MSAENKNIGIPFKDFLDQSTNLITIFGVLNALSLYSMSLKNESAQVASFLLPAFFLLGLFVWFELILFAVRSNWKNRWS
jgi:hypothetical protein